MLKFLKKEANMTHTENGSATYRSTQSECLDLFATPSVPCAEGAMRRSPIDSSVLMPRMRIWP